MMRCALKPNEIYFFDAINNKKFLFKDFFMIQKWKLIEKKNAAHKWEGTASG